MGELLAKALSEAAESSSTPLKTLSESTGLSTSTLSEYQNNRKSPSFASLMQLAKGYRLPFREVVRLWLLDSADTNEVRSIACGCAST